MITMRLKNRPAVTKTIEINIVGREEEPVFLIDGPDTLRLDRYAKYQVVSNENQPLIVNSDLDEKVEFFITNKTDEKVPLATVSPAYDKDNNLIPYAQVLHANTKNKIGELILTAQHQRKVDNEYITIATYEKTVKIIPLW